MISKNLMKQSCRMVPPGWSSTNLAANRPNAPHLTPLVANYAPLYRWGMPSLPSPLCRPPPTCPGRYVPYSENSTEPKPIILFTLLISSSFKHVSGRCHLFLCPLHHSTTHFYRLLRRYVPYSEKQHSLPKLLQPLHRTPALPGSCQDSPSLSDSLTPP